MFQGWERLSAAEELVQKFGQFETTKSRLKHSACNQFDIRNWTFAPIIIGGHSNPSKG